MEGGAVKAQGDYVIEVRIDGAILRGLDAADSREKLARFVEEESRAVMEAAVTRILEDKRDSKGAWGDCGGDWEWRVEVP